MSNYRSPRRGCLWIAAEESLHAIRESNYAVICGVPLRLLNRMIERPIKYTEITSSFRVDWEPIHGSRRVRACYSQLCLPFGTKFGKALHERLSAPRQRILHKRQPTRNFSIWHRRTEVLLHFTSHKQHTQEMELVA